LYSIQKIYGAYIDKYFQLSSSQSSTSSATQEVLIAALKGALKEHVAFTQDKRHFLVISFNWMMAVTLQRRLAPHCQPISLIRQATIQKKCSIFLLAIKRANGV
jgi:hypothetical protein